MTPRISTRAQTTTTAQCHFSFLSFFHFLIKQYRKERESNQKGGANGSILGTVVEITMWEEKELNLLSSQAIQRRSLEVDRPHPPSNAKSISVGSDKREPHGNISSKTAYVDREK